jgi:hypothetical protein
MLIRIPGVNTTTKRNQRTGQVKRYYYHRRTGERLPDDPDSNEFRLPVAKLDETPIGPPPEDKTFKVLIRRHLESTDFGDLAASTKSEYRRHIKYIEAVMGPFLVSGIRPTHAEALKQKFSQTPTLAKAVGRTISVSRRTRWSGSRGILSSTRNEAVRRSESRRPSDTSLSRKRRSPRSARRFVWAHGLASRSRSVSARACDARTSARFLPRPWPPLQARPRAARAARPPRSRAPEGRAAVHGRSAPGARGPPLGPPA